MNPACPASSVLHILAEKWPLLVIHAPARGPTRTSELRRRIGDVSDKMLVQRLRRLKRSGFVSRRAYPEVPPRVDYTLTQLRTSLSKPVKALDGWVERNIGAIAAAQRTFDERDVP